MRWLVLLCVLSACTPGAKEPPGYRDGYKIYRGRTTVRMTVDPKIPAVEPNYPAWPHK